ncbi:hypothetical protein OsI_02622 [Oryza sativa Indica Group]|uniref:SHSP domain-containing protein n=1 Tax=Oryza sativa subsp. indica TaxID=39946 RepID=A2WRY5_ORYSI|nr:hypothetical protein OsI_02622 [Oryza sativa Indica Group]
MLACVPKGSRSAAEVEHRDGGDLREQVWLDGAAAGYVVRLDIAGFSKDEVDVRVNGATGRVTVLGQRPAAAGPHVRLRRVIQLPPTADSDRVAARFVGTTLFLTVPKKRPAAATGVVMATTMEVAETETEKKKERAARWDSGSVVAAAAAAAAFALGVVVSHGILLYTRNG